MANYIRGELTVFPRAVAVTAVDVEYCLGDSDTIPPSPAENWITTVPPPTSELPYIWTRTATTRSNSAVPTYTTPMCITSEAGESITNIEEEYYLSTSDDEPIGSEEGWVASTPEWEEDHYIWTRNAITYSDATIIYTEPVLATVANRNGETQAALENAVTVINTNIASVQNDISNMQTVIDEDIISKLNRITARVIITETEIGFYDNNASKVAWINGNEFHFAQGFLDISLKVGNYLIRADTNGGFAIV